MPGRDRLRAEVTSASRYERLSRPIRAGGTEFVWQAGPGDEKLTLRMRREPDGPLETVLDPNTWPSTEALVYAVPSPDGRLVAFGKAIGSTHDARIEILEVDTGLVRPIGYAARTTWTPHGGPTRPPCSTPRLTTARSRSSSTGSDRMHLPAGLRWPRGLLVLGDVSECGRYAVLYQWDFVHANIVFLLRLADDELVPVATTMQAVNQVQVVDDELLIVTDLDAPRGRLCKASLTQSDRVAHRHC